MSGRYGVKEVFNTIQGEGARAGTRAVFVRFTGCNLWDGHPLHRANEGNGPCALWCDTDFFKGAAMSTQDLLDAMDVEWPRDAEQGFRWCVLTGGEPALQFNEELYEGLKREGWHVAIETNGTIHSDWIQHCDHICLSPKHGTSWDKLRLVHEVKVVLPGASLFSDEPGWTSEGLLAVQKWADQHYDQLLPRLYVQPQDPVHNIDNTADTLLSPRGENDEGVEAIMTSQFERHLAQCMSWINERPRWRLSPQWHKFLGLR